MNKAVSLFQPIKGFNHIYIAQRGNLRCIAIQMKSGGLSLHSPVAGLDEEAVKSLEQLGKVAFLLAPNHYHNKGLKEYAKAFPAAIPVCSKKAKPRLEKLTRMLFSNTDDFMSDLPKDIRLLEPDGLKTGEVWLVVRKRSGIAWIVTDAFCGADQPRAKQAKGISLLGTFPKFGIQDREIYKQWVEKLIATDPPNLIIPSHGGMVESLDLAADIKALLLKKL